LVGEFPILHNRSFSSTFWRRYCDRNQVSPDAITQEDLAAAGDVDRALEEFYAATLAAVTADPAVAAAGVSERSLRTWFDKELITPSGIRSIVLRNERSGRTGSLPNAAVDALSQRFLLRTELRGGGAWVELVHDRFVEPIRASNEAWFAEHLSTLQRAAALWQDSGRASGLLLADAALDDAVAWASTHALLPYEQEFLDASLQLRAAAEREQRQRRLIQRLSIVAAVFSMLAFAALLGSLYLFEVGETRRIEADKATHRAQASELAAEAQIGMAKAIPDPVLALLLAEEAISATLAVDDYVHEKASKALLDAIESAPPWVMNLPFPAPRESVDVPGESVNSAVFSPDGTRILTAGCDEYDEEVNCLRGSARVLDGDAARLIFTLEGHGCGLEWPLCEVMSASYSRDGSRIVTVGADGQAIVWDADSGVEVRRFGGESSQIAAAALSSDGAQIVTTGCALADAPCEADTLDVWELDTGQLLYSLQPEDSVRTVLYSPDDAQILSVYWDGTAQVRDVASRRVVLTLGSEDQPINVAAFSPDGDRIVTAGCDEPLDESWNCRSNVARVWEATSGALLTALRGHRADIQTASFSLAGNRVLTASRDRTARVWDATTGEMLLMLNDPGNGEMSSAAFSPDNAQIITAASFGPAKIWDANWQQVLAVVPAHDEPISSVEFSSDGARILSASSGFVPKFKLWDAQTGDLLREFAGHHGAISSARFSPNNDWIITASIDGTAILWDAVSDKQLWTIQHGCKDDSCGVYSASFSPDGNYVVTTGYDGFARVWDAATGTPMLGFGPHADHVTSASFSRDGQQMVTADRQETVKIWDAVTDEEIRSFKGGWRAAYNPAGDRIATGGITGTLTTWNATTGDLIWSVNEHDDLVWSVEYSPAGDMIVSASRDGSAKLWDAATGRLLFTYTGHGCTPTGGCDVNAATFSPDGQYVATGGYDGKVRIWPATVDALLELADSLISRDPPFLTPEERRRYGLDRAGAAIQ
jgi:WD40 repeat protein